VAEEGVDRSEPYPPRARALAMSSAIIVRLLFSIKKLGPACR
jgi:hypothetical protein